MPLHEVLRLTFAVFLRLCFVNYCAPAHTECQDDKQDVSLLWPNVAA